MGTLCFQTSVTNGVEFDPLQTAYNLPTILRHTTLVKAMVDVLDANTVKRSSTMADD